VGWSEEENGEDSEETNWVLEGHGGGGRESKIEEWERKGVCLCFDK